MPEIMLTPVHALGTAPVGRFGTSATTAPLFMTAPPEGTVLQLLETGSNGIAPALAEFGNFAIRPCAPEQWFAVTDATLAPDELARIEDALTGKAEVIDQSAGRIRIEIEGENVRAALAKGVPIDLHPNVFKTGQSAMTLCGHLGVNITRTDEDRFEFLVMRSYALALWEALIEMGLEFGIECRTAE